MASGMDALQIGMRERMAINVSGLPQVQEALSKTHGSHVTRTHARGIDLGMQPCPCPTHIIADDGKCIVWHGCLMYEVPLTYVCTGLREVTLEPILKWLEHIHDGEEN